MNPWIERAITLFLPSICLSCQNDLRPASTAPICDACRQAIAPAHPSCPSNLNRLVAAGLFTGVLRDLVHAYKYRGRDYLASYLMDLCLRRWQLEPVDVDVLVPVPSPLFRHWSRGYNPAGALAEQLGRVWGLPVQSGWLRRAAWSRPQMGLLRSDRLRNAAASYSLTATAIIPESSRILLIDDVCTTGATLNVCARLLRKAGASTVLASVVAWEPPDKNESNRDS